MNKIKLFGIVSKRWQKYNSYLGTQGSIKLNLIKHSFSAVSPKHKWYSYITEFKLNGQKAYLSPIIDGCIQEIISCTISRNPNLKQTIDMLKHAWHKYPALNGLIFPTDQGWQYQNYRVKAWLKNHGISQSMSRKGIHLMMDNSPAYLSEKCFMGSKSSLKISMNRKMQSKTTLGIITRKESKSN